MTRSSWHCFWMLMTFGAVVLCALCLLLLFEPVSLPVATGSRLVGAALNVDAVRFANELTLASAYFWGFVAASSALGWWACSIALRERTQANRRQKLDETAQNGVDVMGKRPLEF